MYTLKFATYSGMTYPICEKVERDEARAEAARQLRIARRQGNPVSILTHGSHWEIETPDTAAVISDREGTMWIDHIEYECRECGSMFDIVEESRECCEFDPNDDQREEDERIYNAELSRQLR